MACQGTIGDVPDPNPPRPTTRPPSIDPDRPPEATDQAGSSALSRLSRREFESSIRQVFGIEGASELLPLDVLEPFDTDGSNKEASRVYIDAIEEMARQVAMTSSQDAEWVSRLAGCTPTGVDDADCLRAFTARLGLRLWRRPLTDVERDTLVSLALPFAAEQGDFAVAVRATVLALLQSPEFIYRTHIGTPVPDRENLYRLNNFELMSRLAAVLWGSAPSEEMLNQAAGEEITDEELIALAEQMLLDDRAKKQINTFHALWLGFRNLRVPAPLEEAMLQETEALLARVLEEEGQAWSSLFTSTETFVTPELAAHYGMSDVSAAGWTPYSNEQRAGVLSHASMLSLSSRKGNETSPTIRGKFIATQLLCWHIPEPPADVNTDDPPQATETSCKSEEYEVHADKSTGCFNCHALMDPIGFGLERFDGHGVYREMEYGNTSCSIDGQGDLEGVPFSGARELGAKMIESGSLTRCGVKQFIHFATGRTPDAEEAPMVANLHQAFLESGEDFSVLVRKLVAHPVFRHRVGEASQ